MSHHHSPEGHSPEGQQAPERSLAYRLLHSLPVWILLAIALGVSLGHISARMAGRYEATASYLGDGIYEGTNPGETLITIVDSIRHLAGQIVLFAVPLIIIGFVTPSIIKMGKNASKLLGFSLTVAYSSAVGVGLLSLLVGQAIIPNLNIPTDTAALRSVPARIFELNIPQIIPPMAALTLALFLGLAVTWSKADTMAKLLEEFNRAVLAIVKKIVIPVLPVFIAGTFATLAYDGRLTDRLPVFIAAVALIVVLQLAWIAILYIVAAINSRRNPFQVVRYYGPAYLTAAGTMSSAATLPVALRSAQRSPVLDKQMTGFGVPLLGHMHMPGSMVGIVILALTVGQLLYGHLPSVGTLVIFVVLLGIFAVAAPGVPGGTLQASLGLIGAVLGYGEAATALMLAIFALQDSFGTATNITADGPLLMIFTRYKEKRGLRLTTGSSDIDIDATLAAQASPAPSLTQAPEDVTDMEAALVGAGKTTAR